MLDARRNRTLASTALALVLAAPVIVYTATNSGQNAQAATAPSETAAVPTAEAKEPAAAPKYTAAPTPDLASPIPRPEPANLPPPSTADLGGPTTGSVPATRASAPVKEPTKEPAKGSQ